LELVNERQWPPLVVSGLFMFLMITGSYGLVHLMYNTQAETNQFYWYMERAAGFTSYELLAFTVLLGLSNTSAIWDKWKARKNVTQLHQFVSILLFAFVALHLWGLHMDRSIPFPWVKLLFPLTSSYRPVFTGFGVLSLYGVVVLIGSSWLRPQLGVKVWRAIHYMSLPMFVLVTLHGLLTGTDSTHGWAIFMYVIPSVVFAILLFRRIRTR
jgi:sulfoxide reductase heme-binding subunit YedZ